MLHFPFLASTFFSFFLNISNILWVTKNPPKIFIAAKNMANAPKILLNDIISPLISTTCNIAPTMTMPEIAFVTDISGVCRAEVTFQTT